MSDWFEQAKVDYIPGVFGYKQIAKKYSLPVNTVSNRFAAWKKKNIEYVDKKPLPTIENIMEYYESLKNLDKKIESLDTKQTKTEINLPDDKPIGLAFTGDWHTGEHGVDYEQFDSDRELIVDTEGLYCAGVGDYKGNYKPSIHGGNGMFNQIAAPSLQDLLVGSFFEELNGTMIAACAGCHDIWDFKTAGIEFMSSMCQKANCVNLWHGGGVTINIGDMKYKIRMRHKYKGESDLNTTNSQRRLLDAFGPADVICVAHKHYPDLQMLDRMEQPVVYMRVGSYKVYDEYGQQLGGYRGKIGVPMVVLSPDTKKVVPFRNLRDGIIYLKAVRTMVCSNTA